MSIKNKVIRSVCLTVVFFCFGLSPIFGMLEPTSKQLALHHIAKMIQKTSWQSSTKALADGSQETIFKASGCTGSTEVVVVITQQATTAISKVSFRKTFIDKIWGEVIEVVDYNSDHARVWEYVLSAKVGLAAKKVNPMLAEMNRDHPAIGHFILGFIDQLKK